MTRIIRRTAVASALVLLLAAAASGDGDDDDDSGDDDLDAYCEAVLAIDTVPEPDIDFENASEEEIAAGLQDFVNDELQPLVDDAVAAAPDEIADDVDTLADAITEAGETGDFSGTETPEFEEAEARVHKFDVDGCGWEQVDVTTQEYSFSGLPASLPAGPTSFELHNKGSQLHELGIARVNDGVTESAAVLLALPEEEVLTKVELLGEPAFAGPGEDDYKVLDLEPGRYVVACFIPEGSVDEEHIVEGAPPHAALGMYTEFTVD